VRVVAAPYQDSEDTLDAALHLLVAIHADAVVGVAILVFGSRNLLTDTEILSAIADGRRKEADHEKH
jgi:hypothetical protein